MSGYTGFTYDPVLNMYFAQFRLYDQRNMRFTAVDPIRGNVLNPQSINPYIYVLNSPVNFVDPWGLTPLGLLGSATGAASAVGIGIGASIIGSTISNALSGSAARAAEQHQRNMESMYRYFPPDFWGAVANELRGQGGMSEQEIRQRIQDMKEYIARDVRAFVDMVWDVMFNSPPSHEVMTQVMLDPGAFGIGAALPMRILQQTPRLINTQVGQVVTDALRVIGLGIVVDFAMDVAVGLGANSYGPGGGDVFVDGVLVSGVGAGALPNTSRPLDDWQIGNMMYGTDIVGGATLPAPNASRLVMVDWFEGQVVYARSGSGGTTSGAGMSTPGDPNDPNNNRGGDQSNSLRQMSRNQAEQAARDHGFRGAEDLKQDFTFGRGTEFNMHINTTTREIILVKIRGNIQIPTGLLF